MLANAAETARKDWQVFEAMALCDEALALQADHGRPFISVR